MTRSVEISDAAVEAVAASMFEAVHELDWSQAEGVVRTQWLSRARAALVAARPYLMPTAEQIAMKLSLVRFSDEESDRMIELTMREAWPLADAVLALLNGAE